MKGLEVEIRVMEEGTLERDQKPTLICLRFRPADLLDGDVAGTPARDAAPRAQGRGPPAHAGDAPMTTRERLNEISAQLIAISTELQELQESLGERLAAHYLEHANGALGGAVGYIVNAMTTLLAEDALKAAFMAPPAPGTIIFSEEYPNGVRYGDIAREPDEDG
jgi:hypothetical protein